jgi:hypothetical protein
MTHVKPGQAGHRLLLSRSTKDTLVKVAERMVRVVICSGTWWCVVVVVVVWCGDL